MDVYISDEYVARRRAERRVARNAAAVARGGEEKAARAEGEEKRWTGAAAWAKEKRAVADGNAGANPGGGGAAWLVGEDAVLSYFSA